MISKVEIAIIIGVLENILSLVKTLDPEASQNKLLIDIQNVLTSLKSLGIA